MGASTAFVKADLASPMELADVAAPVFPRSEARREIIEKIISGLSREERSEILRNPFSDASQQLLTNIPDLLRQQNNCSDLRLLLLNLVEPISYKDSIQLYTQWSNLAEHLINKNINPLELTREEYWESIREVVANNSLNQDLLKPPFDMLITSLLEVREKMNRLCTKLGLDIPPPREVAISNIQEKLQTIIGESYKLDSKGSMEFTPLGIVLYVSPDNMKQNRNEYVRGLNLRGCTDTELKGLVNIVVSRDPQVNSIRDTNSLNTREHELRHALQYLHPKVQGIHPSEFQNRLGESLTRSETLEKEDLNSRVIIDFKYAGIDAARFMYSSASEEIASYLSGTCEHRALTFSQLGTEYLPMLVRYAEDILWHIDCNNEDKLKLFKAAVGPLEEAHDNINEAQTLVDLLIKKGVSKEIIRAAFEIGGIDRIDRIRDAFGVTATQLNSHYSKMVVESQVMVGVPLETLNNLRTYLTHGGKELADWPKVLSLLKESIAQSPYLEESLKSIEDLKQNKLVLALLSKQDIESITVDEEELRQVSVALSQIIEGNAYSWSIAIGSPAGLEKFIPHLAESALWNPKSMGGLVKAAIESLIVNQDPIPLTYLEKIEQLAVREREKLLRSINYLVTVNRDFAKDVGSIVVEVEELIEQIHRNMDLGMMFICHAPDSYLKNHLPADLQPGQLDLTQIKQVILEARYQSDYWKFIQRDSLDLFKDMEDVPYLLIAARQTMRLDLAYTACLKANDIIQSEQHPMRAEAAEALRARIAVVYIALDSLDYFSRTDPILSDLTQIDQNLSLLLN